ncbi:MAG TPA: hypothetical protein VMB21_13000 [Candidatus Limnocylindria bacterium]|jgi:hypothetical protein|nr:hypothetical protein [Candidatus Limnocylindria bacterium]
MTRHTRITISMDGDLDAAGRKRAEEMGYSSYSQFLAHVLREFLISDKDGVRTRVPQAGVAINPGLNEQAPPVRSSSPPPPQAQVVPSPSPGKRTRSASADMIEDRKRAVRNARNKP